MILAMKTKQLILEDVSEDDAMKLRDNDWEYVDDNYYGQQVWEKYFSYNVNDRVSVVVDEAV